MIDITSDELLKLEYLGSGTFGKVYKKNDEVAYKIYHEKVRDDNGRARENPCLYLPKRRFHTLIQRSQDLKYSGGVIDTIRLNGKFGGVVIPYVKGENLNQFMGAPLKLKVDLSKQMVRGSKELSHHLIYPTDYKLNNVMMSDGKTEIVDLDDTRTHLSHVPNPIFRSLSIDALNETLWTFFLECEHCAVPREVLKELKCNRGNFSLKYHTIDEYIHSKEESHDILFIDDQTDLDEVSKLISIHPYDVVYIMPVDSNNFPPDEEFIKRMEKCKMHGISLFDFIKEDKVSSYSNIVNTRYQLVEDEGNVKVLR